MAPFNPPTSLDSAQQGYIDFLFEIAERHRLDAVETALRPELDRQAREIARVQGLTEYLVGLYEDMHADLRETCVTMDAILDAWPQARGRQADALRSEDL